MYAPPSNVYDPRKPKEEVPSDPWAPIATVAEAPPPQEMPLGDILQSGVGAETLIQNAQAQEEARRQKQQQAGSQLLRMWLGGGGGQTPAQAGLIQTGQYGISS